MSGARRPTDMVRRTTLGVLVALATAGCGAGVPDREESGDGVEPIDDSTADCDDAVSVDGVNFSREYHNDGVVAEARLGDALGAVEAAACGRPIDASIWSTYLAVGTQLRTIDGHDPTSRFAAVADDGIRVYGRSGPGRAAEALDDVVLITVLSEYDARTELGRVDEQSTVRALVDELDPTRLGSSAPSGWDPQRRVFVGLVHDDGLSTQVVYDIATNAFAHGLRPSDAWSSEVSGALERGGDGVVHGSSIVRANGGRIPLRVAGACFPDETHGSVERDELLEVDDARTVEYVFGVLYDELGNFVDSAGIAAPGEGFTPPGNQFTLDGIDERTRRVVVEVGFLEVPGRPSDIALCATLDLGTG